MKSLGCARQEWAVWILSYLSGKMKVGEITAHMRVWTPIMCLPIVFYGEVGDTRETYDLGLDREFLYGLSSSIMMWRRSLCERLGGRAREDGGV